MEQCKWQGQIYAVKLNSHFATNQCRERKISCQTQHLYSVMSNSLQPHWLYSPWNSPDQNTRVGSLSLLQKIFATQDRTQVSRIAGGFFTSWATREVQEYWSGYPIPSPADLPHPGIQPGSPAWQGGILYQLSHGGSLSVSSRRCRKSDHRGKI